MKNYVTTSLEQYLNESKAFTLKRKYGERPAVVVGTQAPARTQILNFVAESQKVSSIDLKKFIMGLNEGKARPAAASMWIKRNAKFFIAEQSKTGITYFKLSDLGKRLLKPTTPTTAAPTAPSMADVTNEEKKECGHGVNEGCGCGKKRPPINRKKVFERFEEDSTEDESAGMMAPGFPEEDGRMSSLEDFENAGDDEDLESETEEDIEHDGDLENGEETEDEDLEETPDEEDELDIKSEVDELRDEVAELRAIIDELTADEDLEDDTLEDEDELADEDLEDDEDEDLDNTEASEFEEDEEIDESSDEIDDDESSARPHDETRKFDFKDKGRPGLLDVDESVETPEDKVKRIIENIKAKHKAKLNENVETEEFDNFIESILHIDSPSEAVHELKMYADNHPGLFWDKISKNGSLFSSIKKFMDKFGFVFNDLEDLIEDWPIMGESKSVSKRLKFLFEAVPASKEDVGATPPTSGDELADQDVSDAAPEEEPTDTEQPVEEPQEEKVEITEFIITVDDIDKAMQELEELGINAERVPKEAETTEPMPQEVEEPTEEPVEEPAPPTEEPVEQPIKEAAGDDMNAAPPAEAAAPTDAPTEPIEEPANTVEPTTEFEENKLKVPADQWDVLKTWLEEKGVDVVEMFGGEIEVEEEPGSMGDISDEDINFDDLEIDDDTKVDTKEPEEEEKPVEDGPPVE